MAAPNPGIMTDERRNDFAIELLDLRHQADDLLARLDKASKEPGLSAGHRRKLKDQRDKLLMTPSVVAGIGQELRR